MIDFETAFQYVMKDEGYGAYTQSPNDAGGATKWGVSLRLFQAIRKDASLGPEAIKALSEDDARAIAKNVFWGPLGCNLAQNQRDATCLLDQGYLDGVPSAAMTAQLALKQLGCQIKADGLLGPSSWGMINQCPDKAFIKQYVLLLNQRYWTLAETKAQDIGFLDGWIKRSNRLLTLP